MTKPARKIAIAAAHARVAAKHLAEIERGERPPRHLFEVSRRVQELASLLPISTHAGPPLKTATPIEIKEEKRHENRN
jgi:hypothetical protein